MKRTAETPGLSHGGKVVLSLLVILIILLAFAAYFSACEAAFFSLGRLRQRQIAERRDRASRRIHRILADPDRALATVLVGNSALNVAFSSLMAATAMRLFADPDQAAQASFLTATLAVLLLGEITPKTLAVNFPDSVARGFSGSFLVIDRLLRPVGRVFQLLAASILRLFRVEPGASPSGVLLSRAELRSVFEDVDVEAPEITRRESGLLQNILQFATRTAEEIMTPRVDIAALDASTPREEAVALMRETRHSRYPIFRSDPDDIIGFIAAKEYLAQPGAPLTARLRPVAFYPENAPVDRIFRELQRNRFVMAIVVNEYGEVVGLITREDLVEEIVGDIYDEFDLEEPPIRRKGERLYILRGRATLHDLNEALSLDLPDEDAVTLNGFLCDVHGHIPRPGNLIGWRDLRFHVLEVARHQVRKVLLELPAGDSGDGE